MARIEKTIEINVPVEAVWTVCTDVEGYTRFMESAKEINKTAEGTYHWKMDMGGRIVEFDSKPTEVIENEKFAWKSIGDMTSEGAWILESTASGTKISMVMDYEIPGLVGAIIDKIKVSKDMEKQIDSNLQKLKALVE